MIGKDLRDPWLFVFFPTLPFLMDSFSSSVDISQYSLPDAFSILEGNEVVETPTFPCILARGT